jgi:hypothetical protein
LKFIVRATLSKERFTPFPDRAQTRYFDAFSSHEGVMQFENATGTALLPWFARETFRQGSVATSP